MSVAGRRVLVVGGTSGIGAATVEMLAQEGAHVVLTGTNVSRGTELANRTDTAFLDADVRDPVAVRASVIDAVGFLGGLDGLVVSAAVLRQGLISETTDEVWDELLETNVLGGLRYASACLPVLRDRGGSIVLLASGTAIWPEVTLGAYSVTKRAVACITQMLAVDAAPAGVRVNAVLPGDTEQGMVERAAGPAPVVPPVGRLAQPEEIASVVSFLLSEDSSACNGTCLVADGGMRSALRAGRVFA